jgi:hypothetical protein
VLIQDQILPRKTKLKLLIEATTAPTENTKKAPKKLNLPKNLPKDLNWKRFNLGTTNMQSSQTKTSKPKLHEESKL